MSNDLQVFDFEQHKVRIIIKDGEPWWVARDVCDVLGLTNITEALRCLDEDEISSFRNSEGTSPAGGNPNMKVISESGLYTLILRSNKPEAKKFRKWVTSVVLPAIRKDGAFSIAGNSRREELEIQAKKADAQLRNANARLIKEFRQMMEAPSIPMTDESKQILAREIARMVTGQPLLEMLPDATDKLYTATEIGAYLGISNRKVHKIAKELGIRAPEGEANELGRWKMTKSPYSAHECQQWVFTEAGRQRIIEASNGYTLIALDEDIETDSIEGGIV